jgi:beta-lactamase superfamily II metal-dependent hydrolase
MRSDLVAWSWRTCPALKIEKGMPMTCPKLLFAMILSLLMGSTCQAADRGLDIYFIDVLGGAATLIVTPEGESVLIDTGWPGFEDRDPKRIEHVLKSVAGRDHLDHLVTTHWHRDHFGGVEGLAKRVRIDHFWDRGLPDPTAANNDQAAYPDGPRADDPLGVAYRAASEGKRKALKAGDVLPLKGSIETRVLASGGKVIDAPEGTPANPACEGTKTMAADPSDNARSLAIRFRLEKFDFLDCGDLTWNVESALVCPKNLIGSIDLYQVTHHGMAISNPPVLLQTIAPTVAIMNNGPKKGGDAATVARLRAIPSIQAAYQLHKNAATTESENTDPALIANRDDAGGEFIHVSVPADGSKFSVQIGAKGQPREFASR